MAACRECDCERREWAADSDCETLECRVWERVLEMACRRASFSGLGGMGGAGPVGVKEGSSSSKGEVRRSGAAGLGGAGVGCVVGVACENWCC